VIKRTRLLSYLYFLLSVILFSSCESQNESSAWDVVDSNSLLVFESGKLPSVSDTAIEFYFFKKTNFYLSSIQKLSKDNFDILYSYLLSKGSYDSLLKSKSLIGQKITNRLFNGVEIYEVKSADNKIQLTFAYLHGIFTLSKSSVLIENAIRVFQNREKRSFKVINSELFQFPSLKSDRGNLYTNINSLTEFFFINSSLLKSIPILKEFNSLSIYDVRLQNDFYSLTGFSLGGNSSLRSFQKQSPVTFNVAKFIPNYSNALLHFGISDFVSFKEVMDSSFLKRFIPGNEIAFISTRNNEGSLMALVEFDPESSREFDFVTDYSEAYSNYLIQSVDGSELKKGFGRIFPDILFEFCIVKDNYLFLSQSVEELKSIIDAIESDETWGKTVDYQKFIEKGLQESNVTLIVKRPDLLSASNDVLKDYPDLVDAFSKVNWYSIQISALDNHFYSNVNFSLGSSLSEEPEIKKNVKSDFLELPGAVRFASLVKNHITGQQELIIQDSDLVVYLISLKDGVIWKKQIDEPIQGPLEQLDYYKNGKLQYFFSTKGKLYIIDRLGRDVTGFPKATPSNIRFSSLVDYDKTKNYRFLTSSETNEVYLFDKSGKNINDWGPKKFKNEIIQSPQHIKIDGKDYFIILLSDGSVQVFNRQGDVVNTFKTRESLSGDFSIESGITFSTAHINYVSKEGLVIKQSLKGEILKTYNLLRGKDSKFLLKRVNNSDKVFYYRTDSDKIVVFDKEGTVLFEKQNSGSMNLDFQCIETKNREVVFSFFDLEQKLVQVFDRSGNSLIKIPIESDVNPLFGSGKTKTEFGIFSFPGNSVVFNPIH
jgi:hypothetical protein